MNGLQHKTDGEALMLRSDVERTALLFPGRLAAAPGHIYAWGKVGGKGGDALPVAKSAVDAEGDCCFPARCVMPKGTGARFVKTSVDLGPFCALDCTGQGGPSMVGARIVGQPACGSVRTASLCSWPWLHRGCKGRRQLVDAGKAPSPTPLPDCRKGWEQVASSEAGVAAVDAEGVILAAT